MADHAAPVTVAHPWRRTARSVFQAVITLASIAPGIYQAATQDDPALATGWVGGGLVVAGGVTRVMALPAVEVFLRRFVPFLAAQDVAAEDVVALVDPEPRSVLIVAGPASTIPDGTAVSVQPSKGA